jgi:hypothetical protein
MNGIDFLKLGLWDYGGLYSKSAQILIFSNFSGKYQYRFSFFLNA